MPKQISTGAKVFPIFFKKKKRKGNWGQKSRVAQPKNVKMLSLKKTTNVILQEKSSNDITLI